MYLLNYDTERNDKIILINQKFFYVDKNLHFPALIEF